MIKNVRVDSVNYRIEEVDTPIIIEHKECGGGVFYNDALIKVGNFLKGDAKTKVLMHEIVHALLYERGMTEASADEILVEELAKSFINLIRSNPNLIELITNGVDENGRVSLCVGGDDTDRDRIAVI